MSRSELARYLGVTRQTVFNWERSGMIPRGTRVSASRTIFTQPAISAAAALACVLETHA